MKWPIDLSKYEVVFSRDNKPTEIHRYTRENKERKNFMNRDEDWICVSNFYAGPQKHTVRQMIRYLAEKLDSSKATRDDVFEKFYELLISEVTEARRVDFNHQIDNYKEQLEKQYKQDVSKIDQEIEKILSEDKKIVAARYAIDQIMKVAGNSKNDYVKSQTIRSIGIIWSAALGMQSLTNSKEDGGDGKDKKENEADPKWPY
jgi:hypothetical protein